MGLWSDLAALSAVDGEDAKVLHCVRLELDDGATLDVYKAEETTGSVTMWRVRGFHEMSDAAAQERQAVVLGTQDDRAIVKWGAPADGMTQVNSHGPKARPLTDLSDLIAEAIRRRVGGPTRHKPQS